MDLINTKNGDLYISEKIVFGRDKKYLDILSINPTNETIDLKNGYKWIYFRDIQIENQYFLFDVYFHNDILDTVSFSFADTPHANKHSDNYDIKPERKEEELYDAWLTEIIGKKRKFKWGVIETNFDAQNHHTSIQLIYTPNVKTSNTFVEIVC